MARGYFRNLVKPVVAGIVADGYEQQPGDRRDASTLMLECVIPNDFDQATREKVRDLLKKNVICSEFIKAPGRPVEVYSLVNSPSVRLLDIPTTLGALRETAIARLGRGITVDMEPAQFQELQTDEIAQFCRALNGLISSGLESGVDIRTRGESGVLAGQGLPVSRALITAGTGTKVSQRSLPKLRTTARRTPTFAVLPS